MPLKATITSLLLTSLSLLASQSELLMVSAISALLSKESRGKASAATQTGAQRDEHNGGQIRMQSNVSHQATPQSAMLGKDENQSELQSSTLQLSNSKLEIIDLSINTTDPDWKKIEAAEQARKIVKEKLETDEEAMRLSMFQQIEAAKSDLTSARGFYKNQKGLKPYDDAVNEAEEKYRKLIKQRDEFYETYLPGLIYTQYTQFSKFDEKMYEEFALHKFEKLGLLVAAAGNKFAVSAAGWGEKIDMLWTRELKEFGAGKTFGKHNHATIDVSSVQFVPFQTAPPADREKKYYDEVMHEQYFFAEGKMNVMQNIKHEVQNGQFNKHQKHFFPKKQIADAGQTIVNKSKSPQPYRSETPSFGYAKFQPQYGSPKFNSGNKRSATSMAGLPEDFMKNFINNQWLQYYGTSKPFRVSITNDTLLCLISPYSRSFSCAQRRVRN